jgi:MYXO-CTERM domain-containing protein
MSTARLLATAAGAGVPLLLSNAAGADFTGITWVLKDISGFEGDVAVVTNVYAAFSDDDGDGIGDGRLIGVVGLPGLEVNVTVQDGVFYQHPLNTNNLGHTAPPQAAVDMFPSMAVDSFMTIGLKVVSGLIDDETTLSPPPLYWGGPDASWTDTRLQINDGAWFAFNIDSEQTLPGHFDNQPGAVLIGQFSVAADGAGPLAGVFGQFLIFGEKGDGSTFQKYVTFDATPHPAPGTLALLGAAGFFLTRRRRR